jgi:iron complex outermembrane receptor protein
MLPTRWASLFIFLLFSTIGLTQQSTNSNQKIVSDPQVVVIVTGTFEPIPLSEANRSVVSLDVQQQPLLHDSLIDALRADASVDLEERAPAGVQADLAIRGATFEQSLVLVNGLRMNDAQTGHHNMDLPIPLEAVSRIEVLHGAGSTLYGADAMGGAVNFITAPPVATEVRMKIGFGNVGFNQEHVVASFLGSRWCERVTAGRDSSGGFLPDRDYRSGTAVSETYLKSGLGNTDILLAGSDRPFGASQFYGDFPSWERTKSWFASIRQDLGNDTSVAFAYRRHSDEFVLVRDHPAIYENNHVSRSWQADLRRRSSIRDDWRLSYGLEADGDEIDSNNLGHHARSRGAGYLNLELQSFRRVSLTLGAREEIFSQGHGEFVPSLAGGVWLRKGIRLRASASRAFRLPTYTDLYYSDPANIGNPLLKPESAWDFEGGPEWNPGGRISAQLTAFSRQDHNDIDYVRRSPNSPWQATNVDYVAFLGVEAGIQMQLPKSQEVGVSYTALQANQKVESELTSKYVFNYPSHNAVFSWTGQLKNAVSFRTRVGVTQRVGQDAYAIWDLAFSRSTGALRPYLQFSNLNNTRYQEIPGMIMPSRTVIGGVDLIFKGHP